MQNLIKIKFSKNIIILKCSCLIAFLCVVSCSTKVKQGHFHIVCEVRNTPAQKIYLRKWYRDSVPVIDSAILSPYKSEVSFSGQLNEETLFSLDFERKGRQYNVIVSDTPIHMTVDCDHPAFLDITGSESTLINNEVLNKIVYIGKIRHEVLDSLRMINAPHEIINAKREETDSLRHKLLQFIYQQLSDTRSPILAYSLMNSLIFDEGYNEKTDSMMKNLSDRLNYNHFFSQFVQDFNKEIKPYRLYDSIPSKIRDFTLETPEQEKINLLRIIHSSKYVLLDFWASWCQPCRRESPYLREAYRKYHLKGFNIISVSIDHDKIKWIKAIREDTMYWFNVLALPSDSVLLRYYNVSLIPKNFLINKNGDIVAYNLGGQSFINVIGEKINK